MIHRINLNPCHLCGGDVIMRIIKKTTLNHRNEYAVSCLSCMYVSDVVAGKKLAAERHNKQEAVCQP